MSLKHSVHAVCMAIVLVLAGLSTALGADALPSDASIQELVALTSSKKLMSDMATQLDTNIQQAMEQALQGTTLSPEQRRVLDEMRAQLLVLLSETMKWQEVDALSADIYKRSFNQREVDGMIAFYKTEAGQAVLNKMPIVAQNTSQAVQSMLAKLTPKVRKLQEETIAKLEAAKPKQ